MKKIEIEAARERARELYARAGIAITESESRDIEIADFGLNDINITGLEIITYVNTERVCAKELALFPRQTCPQHRHPSIDGKPGKEETFRCRMGEVYLYVSGEATENRKAEPPEGAYDVFHEIILRPGEQYTLMPDTWHWFCAGDEGAVVSEFSTTSTDEADVFLDKRIIRAPKIEED